MATEDNTGQLNIVGRSGDGELRIAIKGRDVKVYALLNSLPRDNTTSFDVSTVLGPKKAKEKWTATADPAQPGTLLQAPKGKVLLDEFLNAPASTFSLRVTPPGKLSIVADFSLSGLDDHKAQIEEALTKTTAPVKPAAKPPGSH